jgi:hypothetical protein
MRTPFQGLILTQFAAGLRRSLTAACLCGIAGLFGATAVHAQEAVRYSLSRQLLTAPRPTIRPSFFALGPFTTQLDASLGVSADDNAGLTKTDTHSELVFDQSLGLNMNWVISHLNELGFRFGGSISEVVGGVPGQKTFQFAIDPTSKIELRLFIGDFLIRFHNYLGYVQDPTLNPAVSGLSTLNQLTNTVGFAVDWDLTRLVLSAGLDYSYSTNLGGGGSGSTALRSTLRPTASAAFALTPTMRTGLETAYSASFGAGSHSDVDAFAVGPFLRGKLTRFITLDLAAGLYLVHAPNADPNNYYLSLNISQQLTRFLLYRASFARDLDFSGGSTLSENNGFTLGIQYLLRRNLTLGTSGTINFGKVIISNPGVGVFPGSYVQYFATVELTWTLSRRFTTSLAYRFVDRNADQGSYKQNRVDFSFNYAY